MALDKSTHDEATLVINALFSALDDEQHCKHFLQSPTVIANCTSHVEGTPIVTQQDKAVASIYMTLRALEDHMSAKLTLVACISRLCLVEMKAQEAVGPCRANDPPAPFCLAVLNASIFGSICAAMGMALEVTDANICLAPFSGRNNHPAHTLFRAPGTGCC